MKRESMPGLMLFCAWAVVVAIVNGSSVVEASRVFKVGDEFGWRIPSNNDTAVYSHWATRNRFHIGDSLSFEYQNDSVIEVEKWGYYHCNGSNPITAFDNGNSTIKLYSPGPIYFISGSPGHCKRGQRLIVEVMHIHHHPIPHQSPPMIANPPDQYSSIAPSPLSSSSDAPPPGLSAAFSSVLLGLASAVTLLWFEP